MCDSVLLYLDQNLLSCRNHNVVSILIKPTAQPSRSSTLQSLTQTSIVKQSIASPHNVYSIHLTLKQKAGSQIWSQNHLYKHKDNRHANLCPEQHSESDGTTCMVQYTTEYFRKGGSKGLERMHGGTSSQHHSDRLCQKATSWAYLSYDDTFHTMKFCRTLPLCVCLLLRRFSHPTAQSASPHQYPKLFWLSQRWLKWLWYCSIQQLGLARWKSLFQHCTHRQPHNVLHKWTNMI